MGTPPLSRTWPRVLSSSPLSSDAYPTLSSLPIEGLWSLHNLPSTNSVPAPVKPRPAKPKDASVPGKVSPSPKVSPKVSPKASPAVTPSLYSSLPLYASANTDLWQSGYNAWPSSYYYHPSWYSPPLWSYQTPSTSIFPNNNGLYVSHQTPSLYGSYPYFYF